MEHNALAEVVIEELGQVFMDAMREAGPTLLSSDIAGLEHRVQLLGRRVLGQVVEQVLAAQVAAQVAERPVCGQCGAQMRQVDGARARPLVGLVGDVTLRRPYYHCRRCKVGRAPFDAQVGLGPGGLTPGLQRVVCRGGITDHFEETVGAVAESLGLPLDGEAVRRATEGSGEVAEAEVQAASARARQGEEVWPAAACVPCPPLLLVEVAGVLVRLRAGWQEAKVGRLGPLGPVRRTDPETGRQHLALGPSTYCATLEPAEEFWWRVYVEACRGGLGTQPVTVVVLADGAEWIWQRARSFLAIAGVTVVEIVDYYHATQHLWAVGTTVFGAGTPQASAWVEPLKDQLYTAGVAPLLTALAALPPAVPASAAAEAVRLAQGYFTEHAARMDYPAFVARQFPIGSGAIASTGKALVAERAKGADGA